MFGKNAVASRRTNDTYLVKEIFYTIQGEGPFAGQPAVFVRLGGCNLRCYFCDTEFEKDLKVLTAQQIAYRVFTVGRTCPLIVVTGGEPLLQDVSYLITEIAKQLPHVKDVQFETAGTVWPDHLSEYLRSRRYCVWSPKVSIVVSPKTPKVHPEIYAQAEYWKYLISWGNFSLEDGLPNQSTQQLGSNIGVQIARPPVGRIIYVQPLDEQDLTLNAANAKATARVAMEHGYRISFQMHKAIGVD